jgi:[ribosomal protein S18]-alanine N-acetyltransferase
MRNLIRALFARTEPQYSPAGPRDARAMAALHATSFQRGWSEDEFEKLLLERNVVADRITRGTSLVGFILTRMAADEAEILSIAIASSERNQGLGRRLLDMNMRRLAGLGVRSVFLEVAQDNLPGRKLYQRAGFREVGCRNAYYDHGSIDKSAALILRRELR